MADSDTTIDQITTAMVQPDVVINANFNACSPAMAFGMQDSTTEALTWGYNEAVIDIGGTPTAIVAGTIALTASATNYIYRTSAGVVTKVTSAPTGWPGPISSPAGAIALYEIITGTSSVTSYIDHRCDLTSATSVGDFVGDSGSGGTAGLVPAPTAGDGAASKVLHANGDWAVVTTVSIGGGFSTGGQAYLGSRYIQHGEPQGNQWYEFGPAAVTNTATGTTGATQSASNYYNQSRRLVLTCATAVNSQAGQRWTGFRFYRGSAAGCGGFLMTGRMGADSWHSDGRWAFGMWGTALLPGTTDQPSSLVNAFLFGQDTTDTNIQVMTHDAAAGSTKTTLGGSFPRPTASVSWYEMTLSCQPNASTMEYAITNLHTGATASGSVSTNLPAAGTFLFPFRYANNGPTTTGSVELACGVIHFETTY